MQYIEGRNVRQLVGGQPLDLRCALSITIQVTDALGAASGWSEDFSRKGAKKDAKPG